MPQIIKSLLDLDQYKISMANLVFQKHKNVPVRYAFKNRSKFVDLGNWIKPADLQKQIDYVMGLRFTDEELKYLYTSNNYSIDFINELNHIKLSEPNIITEQDTFKGIEIEGSWFDSILWETILLSIVNQLFNSVYVKAMGSDLTLFNDDMLLIGVSKLEEKIGLLKQYPMIKFMEFGTRRRFSSAWQEYVIMRLKQEIPNQLLGTSNVHYAMKYGLKALGTMAHELFMVYGAIYNEDLGFAQCQLLDDWYEVYGAPSSIALTDTWGTDFFLENITDNQGINFWGMRQDSGDPFVIGEKIVKYYEQKNIDPMGKMIVFSDGLDIPLVIELYEHFSPHITLGFGIGTNLTNDLGARPLSIVIKTVEANNQGLVKLSDNIEKAIGKPEDINRYKDIIGYTNKFSEETVY